jgi:hypothetical protein
MKPAQAKDLEKSVLDEANIAAQAALAINPDYQAIKDKNSELKKQIEEETIRSMTILKVQAMFDSMQMQVDKKIDEMVDI